LNKACASERITNTDEKILSFNMSCSKFDFYPPILARVHLTRIFTRRFVWRARILSLFRFETDEDIGLFSMVEMNQRKG
jgi:hypothetical protein